MKNVNLEGMAKFVEECRKDVEKAKRGMEVVVEWVNDESRPQMRSTLKYAQGEIEVVSDQAPFMGGKGRAPNPIQFCLFGTASCFIATFATLATENKLEVRELRVIASNKINLSKTLGLSDEPIVEKVELKAVVKTDDEDKARKVFDLALQRCPGIYCIVNPIPLEANVEIEK